MQFVKAVRLQKSWGDRECSHPYLEEEFFFQTKTGDFVCTTCGKAGPGNDWPKYQSAPKSPKKKAGGGSQDVSQA